MATVRELYELWAGDSELAAELALDSVPLHGELARRAVEEAGLADATEVVEGRIEQLPLADASADWIWCRDVLVHVDVAAGLAGCARALRPGGSLLAYVTVATDALEPREAESLFRALAVVPGSANAALVEQSAADAGLVLVSRDRLGGEWRERMIEEGGWSPGEDLLRLSRLARREKELAERFGTAAVEAYAGGVLWGVYQLLGNLCPTIYVWRRDA